MLKSTFVLQKLFERHYSLTRFRLKFLQSVLNILNLIIHSQLNEY